MEPLIPMRRRLAPLLLTLAILVPGLVAGSVVGYFYVHAHHRGAPTLIPPPRALRSMTALHDGAPLETTIAMRRVPEIGV